ncbi:MAG: translation initiation factor IF-2 N-terminal domain-containing protein, partial [Oscillospiraceae bacterium]|nr:translation initiation factor IF-2 N-terminal domain-containing protein [Oscillospiraceae bacterium]
MAKKIKLTDAARDLQISPKELVTFLEERLGEKKTTSSSVTEREFNLMLEFYSQRVNVTSFDDYFASKSKPKSAFVSETKKAGKQEPKKEFKKKSKSQKQAEKPAQSQKQAEKPAQPQRQAEKPA